MFGQQASGEATRDQIEVCNQTPVPIGSAVPAARRYSVHHARRTLYRKPQSAADLIRKRAADEAAHAADRAAREAALRVVERWNTEQLVPWSPTIRCTITAGTPWLDVYLFRWRHCLWRRRILREMWATDRQTRSGGELENAPVNPDRARLPGPVLRAHKPARRVGTDGDQRQHDRRHPILPT